ncbi:MAG TPA: glycosyl hydrolase 108 family protein [Candidatus Binataceae bacterium]
MDSENITHAPSSYPPAFERAVARLLGDEGGYADNPADPGGATKFGISRREYPDLDIASLTRAQAIAIYYRDWWQRYRYSDLPGAIGAKVFDLAVNIGPDHATRCLQRALRACGRRVAEDGEMGRATATAAAGANQLALAAALRSEAAGYYRALAALERGRRAGGDREFLSGWLNRAYE